MRAGLCFFVGLCTAGSAQAQVFELKRPTSPSGAASEVLGGYQAKATDWPSTYIFVGANGNPCTATAVGPRVMVTAAHCLPTIDSDGISGKIKGTEIDLWCEKAPLNTYGYDLALCAASAQIPIPKNTPYESVQVGSRAEPGAPLMVLGYGCTKKGGAGGVLYQGESTVGTWVNQGKQFASHGSVALCSGDSGGGAYSPTDKDRRVVGIASDVADDISRFTFLAHPKISSFIKNWQTRQVDPKSGATIKVEICGIDGSNSYCRG